VLVRVFNYIMGRSKNEKRISKVGLQQIFFGVAITSMAAVVFAPASAIAADVDVSSSNNYNITGNTDNNAPLTDGVIITGVGGTDKATLAVRGTADGGGEITASARTNITITGNSDNAGAGEGVTIRTGAGAGGVL